MKKNRTKRVFVGMSGGVDSSVAALLLKNQGYAVIGVFMRCWGGNGPDAPVGINCAEQDAEDARRVAGKIGIPFYVWDFEQEYKKQVVEYMIDDYRRGLTPNPDVMCNKEIKFGLFFKKALTAGAGYVATGHYVRIVGDVGNVRSKQAKRSNKRSDPTSNIFRLYQAKDSNKDQSYFLWTLQQEQLRHCLFPIGDYLKSEVRAIARKAGLPTADKKDSQGICFLGKITVSDFLKHYIPERKGTVLNTAGKTIGEHSGAYFYTVGQRRGLASGAWQRGSGAEARQPLYVADKNVITNTLIVAEGENNPALYRKEIKLDDLNFINKEYHSNILKNVGMMKILARVRYRQPLAPATLTFADHTQTDLEKLPRRSASSPRRSALLVFEQGQKFVAPGQSAVLYTKTGEMLGGGVII